MFLYIAPQTELEGKEPKGSMDQKCKSKSQVFFVVNRSKILRGVFIFSASYNIPWTCLQTVDQRWPKMGCGSLEVMAQFSREDDKSQSGRILTSLDTKVRK